MFPDRVHAIDCDLDEDCSCGSCPPCPSPGCEETLYLSGNVLRCPTHGPMLLAFDERSRVET